jgi:hypothetical protein
MNNERRLIEFYGFGGVDDKGRSLTHILAQDYDWLENTHDYIQWVFPNVEPSSVTPLAPTLTPAVVVEFKGNIEIKACLQSSLCMMLRFYGLDLVNGKVIKRINWDERKANWFFHDTHNNLRIARILKCLRSVGMEDLADKYYTALMDLVHTDPECGLTQASTQYWR